MVVRVLWDAMVDYVRRFDSRHYEAKEFLFSSGGWYLFECLQVSPDAALTAIHARRLEFKKKVLMAYVDPVYENELREWWMDWYGTGFPSMV